MTMHDICERYGANRWGSCARTVRMRRFWSASIFLIEKKSDTTGKSIDDGQVPHKVRTRTAVAHEPRRFDPPNSHTLRIGIC